MPSPLVISVEEDGNPEFEADIVEVDPESVKFDNADEDKVELAEPPAPPAHGVGGAITPPSAEIRSSEQGLGLGCGLILKASSLTGPGGSASRRNS